MIEWRRSEEIPWGDDSYSMDSDTLIAALLHEY
jgi:hypothetical protein